MRQSIDYLVGLGHRDIAYISGLSQNMIYDERCKTYIEYMQRLNLPCGTSLLVDGVPPFYTNTREGYSQATRLIKSGKKFTAVICGNDLMAIGAIKAFVEKGLSVPQDISVMGVDGIEIGRYLNPVLTTMAVEQRMFGTKAFELLYNNMIHDTTGFYRSKLFLVKGGSTGPVKTQSK